MNTLMEMHAVLQHSSIKGNFSYKQIPPCSHILLCSWKWKRCCLEQPVSPHTTGGQVAPSRCDQRLSELHMCLAPGHQLPPVLMQCYRENSFFCGLRWHQSSVKMIHHRAINQKQKEKLVMFIWNIPWKSSHRVSTGLPVINRIPKAQGIMGAWTLWGCPP